MVKVEWSDLPEELVDLIADRVSSHIDLLRSRSICKPWRSAVATKKRFFYRFERNLPRVKNKKTVLSPTSFFRVTLPSSCPNKGWLIKTRQVSTSVKINFLSPLSGKVTTPSDQTLDLLKLGVSEIRQSYNVQYLREKIEILHNPARDVRIRYKFFANSTRVVLVDNMFFAVDYDNEIWCCKGEEESSNWRHIKSEEAESFSDIIVHKGLIYALDLKGAIWWISSELEVFQYRPSTPLGDYYDDDYCKEKRLVEYCGDLCIVHRLCKKFCVKGDVIERTVGLTVYKMDENLIEWVNLSSLGDKALILSIDSCFTVSASEYYGCLKNAIYFTDEEEGEDIVKVFKLDDDNIINMTDTSSHSCFQMFSHPFF